MRKDVVDIGSFKPEINPDLHCAAGGNAKQGFQERGRVWAQNPHCSHTLPPPPPLAHEKGKKYPA